MASDKGVREPSEWDRDAAMAVRAYEFFLKAWQPSAERAPYEDSRFAAELHYLLAQHTELQTRRIMRMAIDQAMALGPLQLSPFLSKK